MWLRLLLFAILFILVIRLINQFIAGAKPEKDSKIKNKTSRDKKVSKDVGEYVDYEELDD